MKPDLEQIEAQARGLSADDRARLAEAMLESLREPLADIESSWAEEVERRVEESRHSIMAKKKHRGFAPPASCVATAPVPVKKHGSRPLRFQQIPVCCRTVEDVSGCVDGLIDGAGRLTP